MPRSVKAVRNSRARKTFRNKKNQNKRLNDKFKKKVGKPGASHILAPIWDKKKSMTANMRTAGLVLNPNKLIKLQKNEPEVMDIEEALNPTGAAKPEKKIRTKKAKGYAKVIEQKAKIEAAQQKAERPPPQLSATDLQFCELMVKRHGLDYDAMARDHENIYQNTAKQFERKIKTFQRSKAYQEVVGGENMEV